MNKELDYDTHMISLYTAFHQYEIRQLSMPHNRWESVTELQYNSRYINSSVYFLKTFTSTTTTTTTTTTTNYYTTTTTTTTTRLLLVGSNS